MPLERCCKRRKSGSINRCNTSNGTKSAREIIKGLCTYCYCLNPVPSLTLVQTRTLQISSKLNPFQIVHSIFSFETHYFSVRFFEVVPLKLCSLKPCQETLFTMNANYTSSTIIFYDRYIFPLGNPMCQELKNNQQ